MTEAYIALGSNLGDRRSHLDHALHGLTSVGTVLSGSPIYETNPIGGPAEQDAYLNAVIRMNTDLAPRELLDRLLALERERGRERSERWGPRTLDCDLLWYDGVTIDEPGLTVPHPGIRNRLFVLAPLVDIAPGLGDVDGPFAESWWLPEADGLVRVTGPVAPDEVRWMVGLDEAATLGGGGPFEAHIHPDWSNTSKDGFGAFLAAIAIRAGERSLPGGQLSQITYRYLAPVPRDAVVTLTVDEQRRGRSSVDLTVTLDTEGARVGEATMTFVASELAPVTGPEAASVLPPWHGVPGVELVSRAGRTPGGSLRSWTPIERWDVPDFADGTEPVFRAWTPHVTAGLGDAALTAASIFMPIDALIWRATLQASGYLPDAAPIGTPTVEITARFARLVDEPWYLGEASIDHFAGSTVAGTVRVWGASGTYAAVGHSMNLVVAGQHGD